MSPFGTIKTCRMQKHEAQNIIESTFNASFSEEKFTLFIKNLLNDIDLTRMRPWSTLIYDDFKKHIASYRRLGLYIDTEHNEIELLIVQVKDACYLDKARTSLRNFVLKWLQSENNKSKPRDYALVAFYSNSDHGADWRFSFVKLEYKTEVKEGKLKQSKELTPAKRYSFLVGVHEKAHTAKKQLLPLLENIYNNPTLEELEEAFSIEKVTDEFFEQYKSLFLILTNQFEKDENGLKEQLALAGIDIPRFTKKLLGQIVFLYFLQKKGWLGVPKNEKWGRGEKKYIQELYKDAEENGKNFFGDYLQHLFYEALAHKHSDEGIKGYYKTLGCKVPFLNGGLFEADYDWRNSHITIPNQLFRNEEKVNKTGDIGTGVLDVFDRYNFTIKEDEPLEKEVAVDPEMLGKVFENMLEVSVRKSQGAFYTPREIVHYMCQESLIHYLDNALNTQSSPPFKEEYPKGEVVYNINNLPHLKTFRKNLRNNLTPAEAKLWSLLKNKQLEGRKFRRQFSVTNYILDFYCPSEKLAIELDGEPHFEAAQADYDYERDLFLKHCGIKVLRFENRWVWDNPEGLLEEVKSNFGWDTDPSVLRTAPLEGEHPDILVPKEDIDIFIRKGFFAIENDQRILLKGKETPAYTFKLPESIRLHANLLDKKLADIKVCDPAIGSGAFPVGMLHEIVNARLVLRQYLKNPKNQANPENPDSDNYAYHLKRHTIQESIYGVDIDASAIDIARLRLWLSLVVDEEDLDNIEALPNLDYKIVCGNSLIGLPENAMRNLEVEKELETLKEEFFAETDEAHKKELRTKINTKIRQLLDTAEEFSGYKIDFDFKLFFSEVWHYKGGFDVVIGNPPFVFTRGQEFNPDFKKYFDTYLKNKQIVKKNKGLNIQSGKINLFAFFILKSNDLTNSHANVVFIIPNNILRATNYDIIREYLLKKFKVETIVDLGKGIFRNVTASTVIFQTSNLRGNLKSRIVKNVVNLENKNYQTTYVEQDYFLSNISYTLNILVNEIDLKLISKIKSNSKNLGSFCKYISPGIDGDKSKYVTEEPLSNIHKKLLYGKDFNRYSIKFKNHYIEYDRKKLNRARNEEIYLSPKVIVQRISGGNMPLRATLDSEQYYTFNSVNNIVLMPGARIKLEDITALLNSSILNWYYGINFSNRSELTVNISKTFLEVLPVKYFDNESVHHLVQYLISINKISNNKIIASYFDEIINASVFELYFSNELKSANKEILKHLVDLKPISNTMRDEEKLAIIQSEFERLYDPNHPVRNNVETLDSVEEVRIIKEALK